MVRINIPPILFQQAYVLSDQDVIDIAGVKMSFFLKR